MPAIPPCAVKAGALAFISATLYFVVSTVVSLLCQVPWPEVFTLLLRAALIIPIVIMGFLYTLDIILRILASILVTIIEAVAPTLYDVYYTLDSALCTARYNLHVIGRHIENRRQATIVFCGRVQQSYTQSFFPPAFRAARMTSIALIYFVVEAAPVAYAQVVADVKLWIPVASVIVLYTEDAVFKPFFAALRCFIAGLCSLLCAAAWSLTWPVRKICSIGRSGYRAFMAFLRLEGDIEIPANDSSNIIEQQQPGSAPTKDVLLSIASTADRHGTGHLPVTSASAKHPTEALTCNEKSSLRRRTLVTLPPSFKVLPREPSLLKPFKKRTTLSVQDQNTDTVGKCQILPVVARSPAESFAPLAELPCSDRYLCFHKWESMTDASNDHATSPTLHSSSPGTPSVLKLEAFSKPLCKTEVVECKDLPQTPSPFQHSERVASLRLTFDRALTDSEVPPSTNTVFSLGESKDSINADYCTPSPIQRPLSSLRQQDDQQVQIKAQISAAPTAICAPPSEVVVEREAFGEEVESSKSPQIAVIPLIARPLSATAEPSPKTPPTQPALELPSTPISPADSEVTFVNSPDSDDYDDSADARSPSLPPADSLIAPSTPEHHHGLTLKSPSPSENPALCTAQHVAAEAVGSTTETEATDSEFTYSEDDTEQEVAGSDDLSAPSAGLESRPAEPECPALEEAVAHPTPEGEQASQALPEVLTSADLVTAADEASPSFTPSRPSPDSNDDDNENIVVAPKDVPRYLDYRQREWSMLVDEGDSDDGDDESFAPRVRRSPATEAVSSRDQVQTQDESNTTLVDLLSALDAICDRIAALMLDVAVCYNGDRHQVEEVVDSGPVGEHSSDLEGDDADSAPHDGLGPASKAFPSQKAVDQSTRQDDPSAVDTALHEHEAASEFTLCNSETLLPPEAVDVADEWSCAPEPEPAPLESTGSAVPSNWHNVFTPNDLQTATSNVYNRVHAPSIPNYQQEHQNTAPEQWQPPVTSQPYWPAPAVPAYRPEDLEKLTEIAAEGLREPQQQVGAQQPQDQAASHGCGQGYAPPGGYDLSGQTTFAPAWQPQPVQQTDYGQTGTQDQHQQGFDFWDVSQINGQYDQPGSSQEQVQPAPWFPQQAYGCPSNQLNDQGAQAQIYPSLPIWDQSRAYDGQQQQTWVGQMYAQDPHPQVPVMETNNYHNTIQFVDPRATVAFQNQLNYQPYYDFAAQLSDKFQQPSDAPASRYQESSERHTQVQQPDRTTQPDQTPNQAGPGPASEFYLIRAHREAKERKAQIEAQRALAYEASLAELSGIRYPPPVEEIATGACQDQSFPDQPPPLPQSTAGSGRKFKAKGKGKVRAREQIRREGIDNLLRGSCPDFLLGSSVVDGPSSTSFVPSDPKSDVPPPNPVDVAVPAQQTVHIVNAPYPESQVPEDVPGAAMPASDLEQRVEADKKWTIEVMKKECHDIERESWADTYFEGLGSQEQSALIGLGFQKGKSREEQDGTVEAQHGPASEPEPGPEAEPQPESESEPQPEPEPELKPPESQPEPEPQPELFIDVATMEMQIQQGQADVKKYLCSHERKTQQESKVRMVELLYKQGLARAREWAASHPGPGAGQAADDDDDEDEEDEEEGDDLAWHIARDEEVKNFKNSRMNPDRDDDDEVHESLGEKREKRLRVDN